jgi:acetyl-CoA/propionyl-CoA carboxylase biotin carboxyl carrier protein
MEKRAIQRALVACRGEAGASVGRRLEAVEVEAVALYADVDAEDAWLDEVSYAARIATDEGADPYQDGLRIVSAALDGGCDAVHPGFGPMAQNAELAHMTANVGLAWIGSPPPVLEACADRVELRRLAREAGFPTVSSSPALTHVADAEVWLAKLGAPLRIAPAQRGTRIPARHLTDLSAFTAVAPPVPFVVERALRPARHVIVGVLGDGAGNAIHIGDHERSLSLGGRVRVRESPAPGLDEGLRERIGDAAVRLARGFRLVGVGAVEFLVGSDGHWWFHDLTPALFEGYALHEEVYGLDLVHAQIRLASGETLGWEQAEISSAGCGIELLVCATGAGTLEELGFPEGAIVSTATGAGATVDPARDAVLARLVVGGPLRHAVLVRARAVLEGAHIVGVPHDTGTLVALLSDTRAWAGNTDTELLAEVAAARS